MRKRLSDDHPTAIRRPSNDRPSTTRREKIQRKTKCVSNDRSRHDDQFSPKILQIGAILDYFWPLQSLRLPRLIWHGGVKVDLSIENLFLFSFSFLFTLNLNYEKILPYRPWPKNMRKTRNFERTFPSQG